MTFATTYIVSTMKAFHIEHDALQTHTTTDQESDANDASYAAKIP